MKKLSTFALTTTLSLMSATQVFAAGQPIGNACPQNSQFSNLCKLTAGNLGNIISSFVTFAFVIIALIALLFLVWGGVKWLMSQGDKNEVEGARNHIINAIIGLIVIFFSYLIVNVLLSFLTGGQVSLSNLSLPTLGQ